jgi:hypothetical protein
VAWVRAGAEVATFPSRIISRTCALNWAFSSPELRDNQSDLLPTALEARPPSPARATSCG